LSESLTSAGLLDIALTMVGVDKQERTTMETPGPLVFTVRELGQALKVGRHTAAQIAHQIGVRVSPRRIVVPKAAVERWLAEQQKVTSQ